MSFSCDEESTACPPCAHHKYDRLQLLSKSSFDANHGKCIFNGTILTIPQSLLAHNLNEGYYAVVAKEAINSEKRNTYVMFILEDVNNKEYNVRTFLDTFLKIYKIFNYRIFLLQFFFG